MRQDAFARRDQPDARASDYEALCAALGTSARGRAFLDEHARRARQAETALALEALSRLEALLRRRDDEAEAKARLRSELRALLAAVTGARANFNKFEGMLAKRETVMALFDMLELRIAEMLADAPAEIEEPANENEVLAAAEAVASEAVGWAEQSEAHHETIAVGSALRALAHPTTAPVSAHPHASGGPEQQDSEPATLDSRLRGNEREKEAPQPARSEAVREAVPADAFLPPAPTQPNDIVARINALTPAERIALFS